MKKTFQIEVFGRVQGVWFRKYTKQKADELGLKGWVRNGEDGSVLMHVEGYQSKH
jgi:acylphosphatase